MIWKLCMSTSHGKSIMLVRGKTVMNKFSHTTQTHDNDYSIYVSISMDFFNFYEDFKSSI